MTTTTGRRNRMFTKISTLLGILCLSLTLGISSPAQSQEVYDPLEPLNRGIFAFNGAFDTILLEPIALGYRTLTPEPIRDAIYNFLRNLRTPLTLIHDLLQGDIDRAGTSFGRFATNTVLGFGGLIDVATDFGIQYHKEDLGQTFAVWGAGHGPYLVLPILGSSSFRDALGLGGDIFLDPVTQMTEDNANADWLTYGRPIATAIDARSRAIDEIRELRESSVDFYATMRSLYYQYRLKEVRNQTRNPSIEEEIDNDDFAEFEKLDSM